MSGTSPFSFTSPMSSQQPFSFSPPGLPMPGMPGSMSFTAEGMIGLTQPMFGQGSTTPGIPGFPGMSMPTSAFPSLAMPQSGGGVVSSFPGTGALYVPPEKKVMYDSPGGVPPITGGSSIPGTIMSREQFLKLISTTQGAAQPVLSAPAPAAPPAAAPAPATPGFNWPHFVVHGLQGVGHAVGGLADAVGGNWFGAGAHSLGVSTQVIEVAKDLQQPVVEVLTALGEAMQTELP